jgi:hypothetical protein
MPRKGHSEEEIVGALRLVEGGQKVSEICREMVCRSRHSTAGNGATLGWD